MFTIGGCTFEHSFEAGFDVMKRIVVLLFLLAFVFSAHAGAADAGDVLKASFNPGLGGKLRPNYYFPVVTEIEALESAMTVTIAIVTDTTAESAPEYVMTREIVPGTVYRCFLYPHCTRPGDGFIARVFDQSGSLLREEKLTMRPFRGQCYVVGILDAVGVPGLLYKAPRQGRVGLESALIPREYMPTRASGYGPADALIWVHPDPSKLAWPSQAEALREWVSSGGRLIVATGQSWEGAAKGFLADLLPGDLAGSFQISDLERLEMVGKERFDADAGLLVTRIQNMDGEVLLRSGTTPLVVRHTVGFGEVIWLAFDPTKSPFAKWRGAEAFWDWLFRLELPDVVAADSNNERVFEPDMLSTYDRGGSIVAGLSQALGDFPKVKPISFAFVVVFLLFYVVLIGPVDYFVLKRLKHLEWTWFTFPSVAIVATLVAFWAIQSSRAVQLYVNQVSVVDWSEDLTAGRTFSYASVLSPRNYHYEISYQKPGAEMSLLEAGSAGGRGGISLTEHFRMVERADWGTTAEDLLIPVWSSRTFAGQWTEEEPALPPLDAQLRVDSGVLYGTILNTGAETLTSLKLLHPSGVYNIGRIEAAESREISVRRANTLESAYNDARSMSRYSGVRREAVESITFHAGLLPVAMYQPAEFFRPYIDEKFQSDEWVTQDLPASFSMRSLLERGQSLLTARSDRVEYPLLVGVGNAERWEATIYRICLDVGY